MKKLNKKILFVLLVVIMSVTQIIPLQAYDIDKIENKCCCGTDCAHTEYTYENIPDDIAERIIKSMSGEDEPGSRGNFFCLFGHDKQTGTIKLTEHNYYTTAPKCRETCSSVEYCVRSGCDYYVVTGQSFIRIGCH